MYNGGLSSSSTLPKPSRSSFSTSLRFFSSSFMASRFRLPELISLSNGTLSYRVFKLAAAFTVMLRLFCIVWPNESCENGARSQRKVLW